MVHEAERTNFTAAQHAGLDSRRIDRDRTLDAIHRLEAALDAAAPLRETAWRHEVLDALAALGESTTDEQRNAEQPDSILSDIARTRDPVEIRPGSSTSDRIAPVGIGTTDRCEELARDLVDSDRVVPGVSVDHRRRARSGP